MPEPTFAWLWLPKSDEATHRIASDPDLAVPALARVVAGDQDHATAFDLLHDAHMSVHHADGAWLRRRGPAVMRPIARAVAAWTDPHRHLPAAPSMRPAGRVPADVAHRAIEQRRRVVLAQYILVDVVAQIRVRGSGG